MAKDSLTITDNRTGKSYELDIAHETYPKYGSYIRTAELNQIKVGDDDFGLLGYDPAYFNTASCRSEITFINGDEGILRYRGYPIEQLAEQSNFIEVTHLLLHGELPTQAEYDHTRQDIESNAAIPKDVYKLIDGFREGSHTMGMLVGLLGSLSTFYKDYRDFEEPEARTRHINRLLGATPTLAAAAFRRSRGLDYVESHPDLGYCANFLNMLFAGTEHSHDNETLIDALDTLLILHADHEQNCSATAMRSVGSGGADVYSSAAGAAAALFGPAHGGANEAVLSMLAEIGDVSHVAEYIERVKNREVLLQGFGHRVYKHYDPRASIIKKTAYQVFEVTGKNPLIDIALELERIALEDDFFVSRKLYPNVDFYSGIIYRAIGLPNDMMTVLFAVGRMSGWLAQWQEMLDDKEQKISRPRQVYAGYDARDYTDIAKR